MFLVKDIGRAIQQWSEPMRASQQRLPHQFVVIMSSCLTVALILGAGCNGSATAPSTSTPEPTGSSSSTGPDDYTKWDTLPVKLSGRIATGAVANSDVMYVSSHTGCASGLPMSLQRTTDAGSTWEEIGGTSPPLAVVAID